MVVGKKLAKESLLAAVLEDEDAETESEREILGGMGSRPASRPRQVFSRGGVDQQTVTRSGSGRYSNPEGMVSDTGERKAEEWEEDGKEVSEGRGGDGDRQEEGGECVIAAAENSDTDSELEDVTYDSTGQTCYTEACRVFSRVPVSYFLRHMQDTELTMMHHGLGPQGTKALAVPLATNTSLLKLDLRDNWMEGMGGAAMAEMLKENCYITELNLAENRLGEHGAQALSSMLQENTTLVSLNLSGNGLHDGAAQHLAQALTSNNKLETLDLSHNTMGDAAGEILGHAIAENTGMRTLSLAWNSIRGKGAVVLAKGLGANIFLRTLDLSYNGLGKDGAVALGHALKDNNTLEELNISNNRIPPEGAIRFAMGLKLNKTIKALNMGRNPIQSSGCYGLLKAIQDNLKSAMESLDFSDITVNQDFEDLYIAVMDVFPNLRIKHGGTLKIFIKPKA